jgi:hypothetical protein
LWWFFSPWDRVWRTICPRVGFELRILLISASWVARIISSCSQAEKIFHWIYNELTWVILTMDKSLYQSHWIKISVVVKIQVIYHFL